MNLIKNDIHEIIHHHVNTQTSQIILLKNQWNQIIGNKLYPVTDPYRIEKNILYINCQHQGYAQSLLYYKTEIISKIKNEYQIELTDIKFRIADVNHLSRQKNNSSEKSKIKSINNKDELISALLNYFK